MIVLAAGPVALARLMRAETIVRRPSPEARPDDAVIREIRPGRDGREPQGQA